MTSVFASSLPSAPYPPVVDRVLYAQRRARVAQAIGAQGVALIPTAPEQVRNRDSHFQFRHDSYFYYLCGFSEPNAWLVITGDGRSTLWCQPKDLEREIWDGYRLGPEAAPEVLGVDAAHSVTTLDALMPQMLDNREVVYYPFATHAGLCARVETWLENVRARVRQGVMCPSTQSDVCAVLDEMRLFKDAKEIEIMRRAAHISAQAHVRLMRTCASGVRAGQDVREYHLEAELLHEFRRQGSQYPAYGSIVAAGANACVLHYRADAAPVRSGDLVLVDAGCELDGYASDITRTFPANGRFSGPQRALYEVVLAAQEAAVQATRVGARFNDPHEAALGVLAQGLLDLGLIARQKASTVQDVVEQRLYTPFYMHRTSHWLGMDVHDCGSYVEPGQQHEVQHKKDPATGQSVGVRPSRILRAGMVLTLEPGLYVRPSADVPEAFHHLGIRIEDDAVVHENGCELITRDVPVHPDEIEALMR